LIPGLLSHKKLNGGAPHQWKIVSPSLSKDPCDLNSKIEVIAIISTWFDADIIDANVINCFRQGCSRVLLLDNDSPDESVAIAVSAGAEVAEVYSTEFYDDDLRIQKENEIAREVMKVSGGSPMWILSLDADEFIHGHNGMTVAETLSLIPRTIRTVGSHAFDLYPTQKDQYVIGEHPGKHFHSGCLRIGTFCQKNHWKHAAIRYDGLFDIAQTRGNHSPAVAHRSLIFPNLKVFLFPFFTHHSEGTTTRNEDWRLCVVRINRCKGSQEHSETIKSQGIWARRSDGVLSKTFMKADGTE